MKTGTIACVFICVATIFAVGCALIASGVTRLVSPGAITDSVTLFLSANASAALDRL